MARITAVKASNDYALRLKSLAEHTEEAVTAAIKAGSRILADAMRQNYSGGLSKNSTGQMLASMGITPVKIDRNGFWNAKVGFRGYDVRKTRKWSNGIPNQLKARVLESGTRDGRIKKHETIKKAIQANRGRIEKAMEEELDKYFQKYLG